MKKWKLFCILSVVLLMLVMVISLAQAEDADIGAKQIATQINGQRIWQFTRKLASDEFAGRLAGTEGDRLAGEYIAQRFGEWGLMPAGDDGTYFQNFTIPLWYATPPINLAIVDGPVYAYGSDFILFSYSGSVNATAEVDFAGYGITIPPYNQADYPFCSAPTTGYDDYAGLDVTDKIVLVLRHGPNDDPYWYYADCPTNIPEAAGSWAFGYKSMNAHLHGAKGMILVNDYRHGPAPTAGTLNSYAYQPGMGAIRADRSVGETLVPDLQARHDLIDATLDPTLVTGPTGYSVNMVVNAFFDPETPTQNVLGAIPGTDTEIGGEVVIVSAHYDHLGVSLTGEIRAGADDDASGTAAMMEIAKVMASGDFAPKRTILFAAWGAEEVGLLGSEYYVWEDPKYPLNNTVAVLQMDMVGVGDRSGVNVMGGTVFADLFDQIAANAGEVLVEAQPFSPNSNSDNAPFFNAGVPAVMIQTRGPHLYYHTPADTIDTIDRYELEQTGRVVGATAYELIMDETFEVNRPVGFLDRHTNDSE